MTELHDLTALEQGELIRRCEVSPAELAEHYLDRIDRLDLGTTEPLGAFVTLAEEHISTCARELACSFAFSGAASVTIPPGAPIVSDELTLDLAAFSEVAITLHFQEVPRDITGHPGSRTTSYLQAGDAVSAPALPNSWLAPASPVSWSACADPTRFSIATSTSPSASPPEPVPAARLTITPARLAP